MASLTPLLNPNSGGKQWVDQISETLKTQIAFTIDTPPVSIFEIPRPLKVEKLEAYVPQQVGLGPIHHFRPELYHKMEQNKLTAVKRVLKPHQIHDCEHIVEKVKKIVPLIRDCYDLYNDADDNMLAWLFTIDGMFLIDRLHAYSNHGHVTEANDLIMLENQIPLIVLKEIQKALLGKEAHAQEDFLESKFRYFCNSSSSFVLSEENINFNRANHLLDYMYNSIVNNGTLIPREVYFTNPGNELSEENPTHELLEAVTRFAGVIPGVQPFYQIIDFVMQKFGEFLEEKTTAEEIKVPSVTELRKVAGVEFRLSPRNEGIRNINFVQEKKDVKLLREQKIIEGDLSDEEIVKMFNGIGKSRLKMSGESELRKTVAQLNMVYESTPSIWVQRTIKKQFLASAKSITIFITISTALILICEVYLMVNGFNSLHMMMARFLRARLSRLLHFFYGPRGPNATI
ncbi:hypothetical protein Hdeb2414_s0027g00693791 [Helianthus debilis subsp. tardiflorus]